MSVMRISRPAGKTVLPVVPRHVCPEVLIPAPWFFKLPPPVNLPVWQSIIPAVGPAWRLTD
jgi:hypothetical protein